MARLPELATGFAARTASPLAARVERLLAWEPRRNDHRPWFAYALLGVSAATVIATALRYHPLLQEAHALTEWLVR
jgi:hypothetical protein